MSSSCNSNTCWTKHFWENEKLFMGRVTGSTVGTGGRTGRAGRTGYMGLGQPIRGQPHEKCICLLKKVVFNQFWEKLKVIHGSGYWVNRPGWRADGSGRADGIHGTGSTNTGLTSQRMYVFNEKQCFGPCLAISGPSRPQK